MIAAGGTNTNGRGGPWGNNLPFGTANSRCIGIEAGNSGDETWSTAVQDSYVKGVAALADQYGIETGDVLSHYEWCKGHEGRGKIDPAGPSRFGSINQEGTWDMDKFRAEVHQLRTHAQPKTLAKPSRPSVAGATIHTVEGGETMSAISRRFGVPIAALISANPEIPNPDSIRKGQQLRIPIEPTEPVARSPIAVEQVRYTSFDGGKSDTWIDKIDTWIEQACAAIGAPFNDHWRLGYNTLCKRESNFDPNAINTRDSNAHGEVVADGHPQNCSRGIAQCIPTTFAENHAAGTSDSIYDPVANIAASMNYVRRRRKYLVKLDGSNLKQQVQQADPDREPKGY